MSRIATSSALLLALLVWARPAAGQDEAVILRDGAPAPGVTLKAMGGAARAEDDPRRVRVDARSEDDDPGLRLVLPEGLTPVRHDALRARVRVAAPEDDGDPVKLRLLAVDEDRTVILQRAVELPAGEWVDVHEALRLFRWGSTRAGRWDEARELALLADGAAALEVAEARLTAGTRGDRSADPDPAWIDRLVARVCAGDESGDDDPGAPATGVWVREAEGFRVVGPGEAPADEAAVARALARLAPIAAWLDEVAPGAARPLDDGPIALAVLPDRATYAAFFRALGRRWRVTIEPPRTAGYTVQDVCAVADDPARGLDRPVLLHEVVHAVVARRLRLLPGHERHDWLQEGLATYLQLALFPEAMDRAGWLPLLRGLRPGTPFAPLDGVLEGRAELRHYAQLASVIGFLVAERPGWLGEIALATARGEGLDEALEALGTTREELQRAWLTWARATLAEPTDDERHFPVPAQWSTDGRGR